MRFSIGGIFAKCPACHTDDFYPAYPLTKARRDVYVCVACNNEVIYSELLRGIGNEAVQRAEKSAEKRAEAEGRTV